MPCSSHRWSFDSDVHFDLSSILIDPLLLNHPSIRLCRLIAAMQQPRVNIQRWSQWADVYMLWTSCTVIATVGRSVASVLYLRRWVSHVSWSDAAIITYIDTRERCTYQSHYAHRSSLIAAVVELIQSFVTAASAAHHSGLITPSQLFIENTELRYIHKIWARKLIC